MTVISWQVYKAVGFERILGQELVDGELVYVVDQDATYWISWTLYVTRRATRTWRESLHVIERSRRDESEYDYVHGTG